MSRKIFDNNLKCLMHFNFPYDDEPNAGLRDELHNLQFFHIADDNNFINYDNPKFGWRCQNVDSNRWLRANNSNNLLNLNPNGHYEFSLFTWFSPNQDRWGIKTFNNHSYCVVGSQVLVTSDNNAVVKKMATFDSMKDAPIPLDAHLATITSENEWRFLIGAFPHTDYGYYMTLPSGEIASPTAIVLGAYRPDEDSPYIWVNGEDATYVNSLNIPSYDYVGRSPEGQRLFLALDENDYIYDLENNIDGGLDNPIIALGNSGKTYPCYMQEWDYLHLDGNILNLKNQFMLYLDDNNKINLSIPNWGINATSENSIITDVWSHVLVRIINGYVKVFVNANEVISAQIDVNASSLNPEFIELGGYSGCIDEFSFKSSATDSAPVIPVSQLKADFNISAINGFGEGSDGEFVATQNMVINSNAIINAVNGNTITVGSWQLGSFIPEVGREVIIHVAKRKDTSFYDINADNYENVNANEKAGLFFFDRITAINENDITLTNVINNGYFSLNSDLLNDYFVQIIIVPNFLDVNISENSEINPHQWSDSTGGGIVIFKSNGNVAVQGVISTEGSGPQREDLFFMNNSELSERFLIGSGGGVFIACAKTLITTDDAVLGGSWGAAQPNNKSHGYAGYGGAGLNSSGAFKTAGSIGYGGAGSNTAGGKPGFNGNDYNSTYKGGTSGACLYIVAGRAAIAYNSFSTGGAKGDKYCGGGGSGFGYVATKILG